MNPSERIDRLIAELTDWRGKTFAAVRKSILAADREIIEEWKWMGSPVWSHDGIIAVANAHKGKVKLTFAYGASLPDPDKLFNASLEGNARRAIDFFEGDKINERALKNLVLAAVDYNQTKKEDSAWRCSRESTKKEKDLKLWFFLAHCLADSNPPLRRARGGRRVGCANRRRQRPLMRTRQGSRGIRRFLPAP